MISTYDKLGLKFVYPSSWTLDESEVDGDRCAVTVQSGQGAFWTIAREPSGAADPRAAAQAVLEGMREEYDELDAEPASNSVVGFPLEGYDVNFICLDFTSTALIRATVTPAGTLVFVSQADDREFADVADVFAAMTLSALQKLAN